MKLLETLRLDAGRHYHFAGRDSSQVGSLALLKVCLSHHFAPVLVFRLAHWCARHHLRPIGKLFSLVNVVVFGLEIGVDSEIGPGLFFPHTSGTVLGAGRIGANAVIYHNVTVGAKILDMQNRPELRPAIGDDAFLGAGCKVLGGITLGDQVTVGANAVVLKSVPSGCLVGGVPAVVLRQAEAAGE